MVSVFGWKGRAHRIENRVNAWRACECSSFYFLFLFSPNMQMSDTHMILLNFVAQSPEAFRWNMAIHIHAMCQNLTDTSVFLFSFLFFVFLLVLVEHIQFWNASVAFLRAWRGNLSIAFLFGIRIIINESPTRCVLHSHCVGHILLANGKRSWSCISSVHWNRSALSSIGKSVHGWGANSKNWLENW